MRRLIALCETAREFNTNANLNVQDLSVVVPLKLLLPRNEIDLEKYLKRVSIVAFLCKFLFVVVPIE